MTVMTVRIVDVRNILLLAIRVPYAIVIRTGSNLFNLRC